MFVFQVSLMILLFSVLHTAMPFPDYIRIKMVVLSVGPFGFSLRIDMGRAIIKDVIIGVWNEVGFGLNCLHQTILQILVSAHSNLLPRSCLKKTRNWNPCLNLYSNFASMNYRRPMKNQANETQFFLAKIASQPKLKILGIKEALSLHPFWSSPV